VVKSEQTTDDGQRVAVFAEVEAGANVRRRGEEYREGELILPAGSRLGESNARCQSRDANQ